MSQFSIANSSNGGSGITNIIGDNGVTVGIFGSTATVSGNGVYQYLSSSFPLNVLGAVTLFTTSNLGTFVITAVSAIAVTNSNTSNTVTYNIGSNSASYDNIVSNKLWGFSNLDTPPLGSKNFTGIFASVASNTPIKINIIQEDFNPGATGKISIQGIYI